MISEETVRAILSQKRNHTVDELRDYPVNGYATPSMRQLAHRAMHFQGVQNGVGSKELAEFLAMTGLDTVPCSECDEAEAASAVTLGEVA